MSVRTSRHWWDREAIAYYAEHGPALGDACLSWGPEGITETQLGLLGDLSGAHVLEFGSGAAQGARWCASRGGQVVASDISAGMLAQALEIDRTSGYAQGAAAPVYLQCDAARLPFGDGAFDVAFSAYGALPFVPDPGAVLAEVSRVLAPGGRCVFSLTHPFRWVFPDLPGPEGLSVATSYFDTDPYVETDAGGQVAYVEHHATVGDMVRSIVAAGLTLVDLLEPPWPANAQHTWGAWSPLRGHLIPGTALFDCRKAASGG